MSLQSYRYVRNWGGEYLPHLEGEQRVEAGAPVDAEGGAGVQGVAAP